MARGVSPQASTVVRPTSSRAVQISGTASIGIQWNCTFCRSVMSATPRAYRVEMSASTRSWARDTAPPSNRTRIMKYSSPNCSGDDEPVLLPGSPAAVGCTGPPAQSTVPVLGRDRGEPLLRVSGDPFLDRQPTLPGFPLLDRVQRRVAARRPLSLLGGGLAACAGRGAGRGGGFRGHGGPPGCRLARWVRVGACLVPKAAVGDGDGDGDGVGRRDGRGDDAVGDGDGVLSVNRPGSTPEPNSRTWRSADGTGDSGLPLGASRDGWDQP
jgi:hypothetical protein